MLVHKHSLHDILYTYIFLQLLIIIIYNYFIIIYFTYNACYVTRFFLPIGYFIYQIKD